MEAMKKCRCAEAAPSSLHCVACGASTMPQMRTRWPTPQSIRLFVTGGTFDKEYDEIRGELFFKDTHVAEMLELGRSKLDLIQA